MPSSQQRGMRYGPGDIVKDYYDAALGRVGGSLWRGIQAVAGSGIVKGAALGALFVVGATAFTFAFGASSGMLTAPGAMTLGEGLKVGLSLGLHALFDGLGIAAMAIGGAIGFMSDRSKAATELSATDAKKLADAYEIMRTSPQKQPAVEQTPEQSMSTPEKSFRTEEMNRRARNAGANQLRQGYGPR